MPDQHEEQKVPQLAQIINATFTQKLSKKHGDQSVLDFNWDQALKLLEKYQLREIPWHQYTTLLLVKHYNLITENGEKQTIQNPTDQRNKRKIEDIVMKCILVYQEKEDGLTSDEFGEIINLGSIKHRADTQQEMKQPDLARGHSKQLEDSTIHSQSLFHRILARLVVDIRNDELFEPQKIEGLAQLIAQVGATVAKENEKDAQ